jgi:tyrosyl-tRNA synthetase
MAQARTQGSEEVFVTEEEIEVPAEIVREAQDLARGAEVLPEGYMALARRIYAAKRAGRKLRVKFGVDPTSMDLHLGHAVVLNKLKRFQDCGHQVVLIIGGFTAQVGDPSGRSSTRPQLTAQQVEENAQTYLNQVGIILDTANMEILNNADWLAPLNLADLLKLASQVTANQLLAKEAFGDRLDKQQPVHFHELFYPLLQAYDSIAVRADIEFGGTDQRFNLLQGRELQPCYGQEPQLAIVCPLLEGTDGEKKMSKSFNNYIALKDEPNEMFGKCMRIPDHLILKYFELTTSLSGSEIDAIKTQLEAGTNPKDIKEKLGQQIVSQYHGAEAAEKAVQQWNQVHSQKQAPDTMPSHVVKEPTPLFRLVVESGLAGGSGEAKRLIQEGGVRLDNDQLKNPNEMITLASGESKVLQVGRRKFVRLTPG